MLIHAKRFWPDAIAHMIWPFAVSHAICLENELSIGFDGESTLQRVTATDVPVTFRNHHTWGFPVHVIESKVQTSSKG